MGDTWILVAFLLFAIVTANAIKGLKTRIARLEKEAGRHKAASRSRPAEEPEAEQPPEPAREFPQSALTQALSGKTEQPKSDDADRTPPTQPPSAQKKKPFATFEQHLTANWMVWLGGLTLALGGGFFVKYSIEQGLLGPTARVVMGTLAGAALIVGGEVLRRKPLARAIGNMRPDHVPTALAGAGIFIAFASIYAAYALHDLFPALIAFVLLAGVSALCLALSLVHGPFLAYLGIAGAYGVPLLVSTGNSDAYALFPYLLFVGSASMGVIRYRAWWQAGWLLLAGALWWPLLWLAFMFNAGDAPVIGFYLVAMSALYLLGGRSQNGGIPGLPWRAELTGPNSLTITAVGLLTLLLYPLMRDDLYGTISVLALVAQICLVGWVAFRRPAFTILLPILGLTAALALGTWHIPFVLDDSGIRADLYGQSTMPLTAAVMTPTVTWFLQVSGLLAALFTIGGFVAGWRSPRPGRFAATGTATALVLMALAYWRVEDMQVSFTWGLVALALAALFTLAAERWHRVTDVRRPAPLAAYAVGVCGAVALAFAFTLRDAWLTAAIAALVPAIALINTKIPLPALRRTAAILVTVLLVRLALNPALFDYSPEGMTPIFNWLLYGYALPAGFLFYARRIFIREADDRLIGLLDAGILVLVTLFIDFQIRSLMSSTGNIGGALDFIEAGMHTAAWLGLSLALAKLQNKGGARPVLVIGRRVLMVISLLNIVFVEGLFLSPLMSTVDIGSWPVVNALLIAFGLPAILGALLAYEMQEIGDTRLAALAAVGSLGLFMFWITLEVRHGFQGSTISLSQGMPDPEWYAYSVAWLLSAVLLLAAGMKLKSENVRRAALVVLALTVLKAFLSDMAALEGLWRALSFMGLGLTLVGIGYVYQRFVFPPGEAEDTPA